MKKTGVCWGGPGACSPRTILKGGLKHHFTIFFTYFTKDWRLQTGKTSRVSSLDSNTAGKNDSILHPVDGSNPTSRTSKKAKSHIIIVKIIITITIVIITNIIIVFLIIIIIPIIIITTIISSSPSSSSPPSSSPLSSSPPSSHHHHHHHHYHHHHRLHHHPHLHHHHHIITITTIIIITIIIVIVIVVAVVIVSTISISSTITIVNTITIMMVIALERVVMGMGMRMMMRIIIILINIILNIKCSTECTTSSASVLGKMSPGWNVLRGTFQPSRRPGMKCPRLGWNVPWQCRGSEMATHPKFGQIYGHIFYKGCTSNFKTSEAYIHAAFTRLVVFPAAYLASWFWYDYSESTECIWQILDFMS